jgi:FG-GAP repeat
MRSVERRRWSAVVALVLGLTGCVESVQFTPLPPSTPKLRLPQNGSYEGSIFTDSLRPTFVWEVSGASEGDAISYDVQYSTDPEFGLGTIVARTDSVSYTPDDPLSVSRTPPVGRRYYWRVRACLPLICSEYSTSWQVNLGRSERDLNGDGYADIAIGASGTSQAGSIGRVYVYFGGQGASFDASPDGVLSGSVAGGQFGRSISSGGDFNGDGFADLLVADPFENSTGITSGRVYLYLGGTGAVFESNPDSTVPGFFPGDRFGTSVSISGDLNSDGFSDAVVGAPYSDSAGIDAGRVYVYFGGASATLAVPVTFDGERANEYFGKRTEIVGDLNGDGYPEMSVDEGPVTFEVGVDDCYATIFLGGQDRVLSTQRREKIVSDAEVGCSLLASNAGDLNRDGFSDLIVGYSVMGGDVGFLLGRSDVTLSSRVMTAPTGIGLGTASPGDLNGDGTSDIVLGANGVGLYFGQRGEPTFSLPARAGQLIQLRAGATSVGDLNGDGFDDLVVGVPTDETSGAAAGRAFIYFGGETWDSTPDGLLDPAVPGSRFGTDVS